jgi:hypothetical protein
MQTVIETMIRNEIRNVEDSEAGSGSARPRFSFVDAAVAEMFLLNWRDADEPTRGHIGAHLVKELL